MKTFTATHRIIAVLLSVMMLFTVSPVAFAGTTQYPGYEFVVTSDKTSVDAGDVLILTVTVNGPMANASMIQYQIVYDSANFTTTKGAATAYETEWYNSVKNGSGLGAISKPSFGNKTYTDGTTMMVASGGYLDKDAEMGYGLFISEDSELYTATSAVAGKIKFTAVKAISDVSDCFRIENVKNGYGDENGDLAKNITGTTVQLADTIAVQKVIAKIDAIGSPVTYSSKAKITEARTAYDAITNASLKALVTNIATLTNAESAMGVIEQRMANVKALIAAIGTVTLDSEEAINSARTSFAALADDEKAALAADEKILIVAEDELASLKQAEADKAVAQPVVAQIDALFPVTLDSGSAIDAADAAYKTLTPAQQTYVTNYAKIAEARSALAQLQKEAQEAADKAAAQPVIEQINALFPVTLDSGSAIEAAKAAYNELTPAQQAYVTNYASISEAEQKLATLKAQKAAADEVSALIALIPNDITKENAADAREAIDTAKTSFDVLGAEAKELVPDDDVSKLNEALEIIALVEQAIKDADAMDKAIEALFPVTLASGDAIEAAEAAFEELSELAASYVTGKANLDKARTTYEALVDEENEVQRIIGLIDALGDVDGIDYGTYADVLADAKAAEEELKALDSTLVDQTRVTNRAALNDIIDRCLELQESMEKIEAVIAKIASLGEITLGSATDIDIARGLYDDLTETEQAMVTNYSELEAAEGTLEELIAAAEQEELDRAKAAAVDALIEKIGEVEYTSGCWTLISEAKQAYSALTESQKEYVENADALAAAEAEYLELKADAEAVDAVIKEIDKIGKVEYSEESLARIESAEELYNALDEDLKAEVTNAYMIDVAKQNYQNAKKDYEDVQAVIEKIVNIGDIAYTEEVFETLTDAQDAYDALRDDLKELVTNYNDLVADWELYNSLKPIIMQKNDVLGYKEKHVTVVTNVPANMTVSFASSIAQVVEIGGNVYHVLVTEEIISPSDVFITDVAPEKQNLGSVINNDGNFTATDALFVNKFVAGVAEPVAAFANDPLTYVRADVNGSGGITAMDALMIAKKAAGETIYFKLYVGMNANN